MKKKYKKRNTSYIFLNGGLGNQMFGLSAALYASEHVVVLGGASIAKCRKDGLPELFNFHIDKNVKFRPISRISRSAIKKLHNYLLTSDLNSREHILFKYSASVKKVLQSVLSLLSKNLSLVVSNDVGYAEVPKGGSKILIGYFQSYEWLEDPKVKSEMQKLFHEIDSKIITHIDLARKTKPLIVHVRLGDYKHNHTIGVLPQTYFAKALQVATSYFPNTEIWVFSDEPILARQMIPLVFHNQCRWISEEFELTAEETMALMRHGRNFVISNSTFSWWPAALSEFDAAQVFYPDPWFANGETPNRLIPGTWIPISRIADDEEIQTIR
jgi:hypothetical protein